MNDELMEAQPPNARTLEYWSDRLPVPAYDRDLVMPGRVHVGVGGFHRAQTSRPDLAHPPSLAVASGASHRQGR
jgi:hypothetical protein